MAPWLMMSTVATAADCPEKQTNAQVSSLVDEALLSFAAMDQDSFEVSADQAVDSVPCLEEAATPQLAAAIHRVRGIRLFVGGDEQASLQSLAAAYTLAPDHRLSEIVAPEGGQLHQAWTDVAGWAATPREALAISGLDARVDGSKVQDRPKDGPYVYQVLDGSGNVVHSEYLVSAAPLMPPEVLKLAAADAALALSAPEPAPAPAPAPVAPAMSRPPSSASTASTQKKGKGLLWAGLTSGVVAGGLYGGAAYTRTRYDAAPTNMGYTLTNGAYFGSIGTAALSGVLLSTFVVTR